jgi:hypothetical protein
MSTPPAPRTATATRHPFRRRAAAAALGLLTAGSALGFTATPASAEAPKPVKIANAIGYDSFIRVFWTSPANGGDGPFTYTVERYDEGKVGPQKVWQQSTTRAIEDKTAQFGVDYQYRVKAVNGDGTSSWSTPFDAKLNPQLDQLHKFDSSTQFVKRQYQDLLGRQPGFGELNTNTLNLENGTKGPDDVIDTLVKNPDRVALRQPVIRLYQAFFDRTPDHNGLDYWLNRRANGKKLDDVANNFASSSEFKTKYGALSNHDFVELIYTSVLKRPADPTGLDYWTNKLATKQANRGRVMTQFSESNEFKTKSLGKVVAIDVYDDMVGAPIPPLFLATFGSHLQGGGNAGEFATWVMLQSAYQGG